MNRVQSRRWDHPTCPAAGPLDEAARRTVFMALAGDPEAIAVTLQRFGIGPWAGQVPRHFATSGRWTPARSAQARQRVASLVAASGMPAVLMDSVDLCVAAMPASPVRLSSLLYEAGLTDGVLHPMGVVALAGMWRLPVPAWTYLREAAGRRSLIVGADDAAIVTTLATLASRVRAAGVLPLQAALDAFAVVGITDDDQVRDVLKAWALYDRASPVLWDRLVPGRLLRPIQRLLAACGPLALDTVLVALHRVRCAGYAPAVSPMRSALAIWAAEHPMVGLDGGVLSVTDTHAVGLLTPSDRSLLSAMDPTGVSAVRDVNAKLVASGVAPNTNAARSLIAFAPFVQSAGRGRIRRWGDSSEG